MKISAALLTSLAHVGDFKATPGGDYQTISGLPNLKNAIFHRLMTVPGTLVHQPLYGCGVPSFQNAPTSFAVQQKLAQVIQEQLLQDERIDSVLSVGINFSDVTPEKSVISITVKPVGYTDAQTMTFTPFSGGGGL